MTAPKKTADDARIVLTLHFKIPKDERDAYPHPTCLDALNVLRRWVEEMDGCSKEMLKVNLNRLIDNAVSFDLAPAK